MQKGWFYSIGTTVFLTIMFYSLAHAEVKSVIAEARYQMGDGESPSFAESMVLQKAKQHALEEAGTYIESNTVIRDGKLTQDEVRAVAGGLMTVEVLDKSRGLIGDGLVFQMKIKATVNTDNLSDLVGRVKGKDIAEEYKALQKEYRKLYADVEKLKDQVKTAPAGAEREAALDQIRDREKAFAKVQKNEAILFQRMVSGEKLFGTAMAQIGRKSSERETVDALFQKIVNEGLIVSIGEPQIDATLEMQKNEEVFISLPVTMEMVNPILSLVKERSLSFGGKVESFKTNLRRGGLTNVKEGMAILISSDFETVKRFQNSFRSLLLLMEFMDGNKRVGGCYYYPDARSSVTGNLYFPSKWDVYLPITPFQSYNKVYETPGLTYFSTNKLYENDGYVGFFTDSLSITFRKEILLKDAKRITSVRGKFVSVPLPVVSRGADYKYHYDGLYSCKVTTE